MSLRKILFLDRDGTLIEEPADFQIDSLAKFRLVPGMIPALLKLKAAGYEFVMVSNQDGLGTDSFPLADFEPPQQLLLQILESQGIRFSAIHIDPHFEHQNAPTRKPGIGMLLGWLVFVRRRLLFFTPGPAQLPPELGLPPNPELLKKPLIGPINREWLIYIVGLLSVGLVWLLVQREPIVNTALTISSFAMLAFFIYYMITKATLAETGKLILAIILVLASVVFFTLFELAGYALSQFSERSSQLCIAGACVTSGQTQSFNGAYILIFAPIFAAMWTWLGRHKRDPGDAFKFALLGGR